MSGNTRFELASSSSDSSLVGNYQNGQKGYSAPNLDRSASFREGAESRTFGSGKVTSRGIVTSSGNVPTLSQCLMLEPIAMNDQKYSWSGELIRVLGFSVGSGTEDNSCNAAHLKNSPPVAMEEIKRLRASVADTFVKASGRAKRADEHLNKLNKYIEAMTSKKQQRNNLLTNERSCSSTLKIIPQINRNPSELGSQKLHDRPKNVILNKRVRTSVAETRVECHNNGIPRQPLVVTKERDLIKDKNAGSDHAEEKIRRLPAGGEGWDKKMKRKRSISAVFSRSIDNEGEPKRTMHHKRTSESSLQLGGLAHGFRSGASVGSHKLDTTSSPAGSSACVSLKSEQEKSILPRDLSAGPNKERALGKANVRLNNCNDNRSMSPSPIIEGKASRTPQSGSMILTSSASNICRTSVTLESWEQSKCANKYHSIGGANNRKRAMPVGSSSQPITKWVGQRPQKISRTRRTNLIPVSNGGEVRIQSEGCSPSDFGPRLSNCGTNSSHISKSAANGNQHFKVGPENVPSPARLSEKEDPGAVENRLTENGVGSFELQDKATNDDQIVGPFLIPPNKNKIVVKEEIGCAVRKQGRSGRASQFSGDNISPTGEKLDNVVPPKPLRNARSGFDRCRSKSGRPLKKLSDRKGFSRLGHLANGDSPDFSGEPEDDHEELLAAAHLAYKSSFNACSSSFWKTVEALFSSIGLDKKSYLAQQLKLAEESNGGIQNCSHDSNAQDLDDYGHEEIVVSDTCEQNGCMKIEQCHNPSLFGSPDVEKRYGTVTPLLQRLLSALIVEDEIEESEETGFGRLSSSVNDPCLLIGNESRHMDGVDFCEPIVGVRTQKNGNTHIFFSCNGNMDFSNSTDPRDHLSNGEILQRDGGYVHSEVEVCVRLSRYDYVPQSLLTNNCGISSFNYYYERMHLEYKVILELHSIGLFLETMPTLDDKDVEISQEIVQLEKGLHEQMRKKKVYLNKIHMAVEDGNNVVKWDPEQLAMDKLVELAYKKLSATKGSFASKHGIAKVSKQVALAFAKRTLTRCQKFEDSGASCFAEPALQDIVYAEPAWFSETELLNDAKLAVANSGSLLDAFKTSIHQSTHAFAKNGPISNRGKNKEVLLEDVVGSAALRASSALGSLGGAKGKRSDRDRDGDFSTRIAFPKAGRSSMGGSKCERRTKSKPKQKATQLSASGIGFVNNVSYTTDSVHPSASGSGKLADSYGNRKQDVRFMSSRNGPLVSSKEMKESVDFSDLPLNDIDGMEELGVDSDIGAPQDLNSWFNFDVDGLPDHDSAGLEIPMDDISELNMF